MAWSVCLPLVVVMCSLGVSTGVRLSQYCSKANMPTVPNFDANLMKGAWYNTHLSKQVGTAAAMIDYKDIITSNVAGEVKRYMPKIAKAVYYGLETCGESTSFAEIHNSMFISMQKMQQFRGSFYLYHTEFHILATDYTSTMVMMMEFIRMNVRTMDIVQIYVRDKNAEPNSTVVTAAMDKFCGGALNDLNSQHYVKLTYQTNCF